MRSVRLLIFLLLTAVSLLYINGCQEDPASADDTKVTVDSAASKAKSDLAYSQIEAEMTKMINGNYQTPSDFDQLKFQNALASYNDAIALNPNNDQAQFGAAVSELLSAYSDAEINKLIKQLDSSSQNGSAPVKRLLSATLMPNTTSKMNLSAAPAAAAMAFMVQKAVTDPPLVSKVQSVLRDYFLPRVQRAIGHLAAIENKESFKFVISGSMQGDPKLKTITLYPTEVSLLSAAMQMLRCGLESMMVFKFELADYKQSTLINAFNQNSTNFFALQTDGKQRAANAKEAFTSAIAKMKKAIDYLQRISGSKTDAIIKIGSGSGSVKQNDLDTLNKYLDKLNTALTQDYSIEIKDGDTDGKDYTIKVNLGNMFANIPANPKAAWLPPYTVKALGTDGIDIQFAANTYAEFNFPDPTFGGLFPGMAQETLKRLLHIDEEYGFVFEGYISLQPYEWYYTRQVNATVKLYTSGPTYQTVSDSYGEFRLIVKDATTTAVPVTKVTVTYNGTETEFSNVTQYQFAGIKAKLHEWANFELIRQPVSLAALQNGSEIVLTWNTIPALTNSGSTYDYQMQRKEGSGTFTDIPTYDHWSNPLMVSDYSAPTTRPLTYRVRTKCASDVQYSYGDNLYYYPKNPVYSNETVVATNVPVSGSFISEGSNLSTYFKTSAKAKKMELTINNDLTFVSKVTDSSNNVTTFSGTFSFTKSSYYDYSGYSNTSGQPLYNIIINQTSPSSITAQGLLAFNDNNLTAEYIQISPAITGFSAPTANRGFGSTTYNNGSMGNMFVQKYVRK